jgi:hypothetical protein
VQTNELTNPGKASFSISSNETILFIKRICTDCSPKGSWVYRTVYEKNVGPSSYSYVFPDYKVKKYEKTNIQDIVTLCNSSSLGTNPGARIMHYYLQFKQPLGETPFELKK